MESIYFLTHTSTQLREDLPIELWNLSPKGREQAATIAEEISHLGITRVVSSLEPKAIETASIVAGRLGIENTPVEGLHEVHRQLDKILPLEEFLDICVNYLNGTNIEGWENITEAQKRLMLALNKVAATKEADKTLVVGHGLAAILIECAIGGIPTNSRDFREQMRNGSGKYLHLGVSSTDGFNILEDWA